MTKPKSGERVLKVWLDRDPIRTLNRHGLIFAHKRKQVPYRQAAFLTIPTPKAKRRKP